MAVVQLSTYVYIGLNGDTRPASPIKGARYIAYDVGGEEYYDGTSWQAVSLRPGYWTVVNTPAANTQATISKAAGGAGVRHVCTGILATLTAGVTAPAAVALTVELRDGATGAGTVIWQGRMSLGAIAGQNAPPIQIAGLSIVGSANTAMTLEFSAAGGANTLESVSLAGYSA